MQQKTEQEEFYEALCNANDEIMFVIASRENNPEDPRIIYDEKEHALFYRAEGNAILLDFLHPEVRPLLAKSKEVLISEVKGNDIIREYDVPVKLVKKLPIAEDMLPTLKTGSSLSPMF